MHFLRPLLRKPSLNWIVIVAALVVIAPRVVHAEALLVVEADTGKVLQAENATYPWYPASVTKMMTAYVTLKAVKEGRLTLDTVLTVSPVAASQSPSKMGFRPGTQVTVENALQDDDGEVGQRHGRGACRRRRQVRSTDFRRK